MTIEELDKKLKQLSKVLDKYNTDLAKQTDLANQAEKDVNERLAEINELVGRFNGQQFLISNLLSRVEKLENLS
jgi:predicted  nucleic acid-binding Zn-ribbon protein